MAKVLSIPVPLHNRERQRSRQAPPQGACPIRLGAAKASCDAQLSSRDVFRGADGRAKRKENGRAFEDLVHPPASAPTYKLGQPPCQGRIFCIPRLPAAGRGAAAADSTILTINPLRGERPPGEVR